VVCIGTPKVPSDHKAPAVNLPGAFLLRPRSRGKWLDACEIPDFAGVQSGLISDRDNEQSRERG
jgi:hypothetical protein